MNAGFSFGGKQARFCLNAIYITFKTNAKRFVSCNKFLNF